MEAIFVENLENIRHVATQKLGQSLGIASIVYLRHMNDTARAIFGVALENEPGISVVQQRGDSYDVGFRAYSFRLSGTGALVFFRL